MIDDVTLGKHGRMVACKVDVPDLRGTWRRSLLQDPLGYHDVTSEVTWVQGPRTFGDLRQPPFAREVGATCLRHLTRDDVALLAQQQGFGGTLVRHPDHFEWLRVIDYQPKSSHADRGGLMWQGDVLVETGHERPYVEHWHRDAGRAVSASALHLAESGSGCLALIVGVDDRFAFIRDRMIPLDGDRPLLDLAREAHSLEAMQDVVDCEVSVGFVGSWRIERSTLPWRVGASLAPNRTAERLVTADLTPFGEIRHRSWTILDEESA